MLPVPATLTEQARRKALQDAVIQKLRQDGRLVRLVAVGGHRPQFAAETGSALRANASTMPGMTMSGGAEVQRTSIDGRYQATAEFGMSGAWRFSLDWQGPAGASVPARPVSGPLLHLASYWLSRRRSMSSTYRPAPTPASGSGNVAGTELVEEQVFLGQPCFRATRIVFGLRGEGTVSGLTAGGQPASSSGRARRSAACSLAISSYGAIGFVT